MRPLFTPQLAAATLAASIFFTAPSALATTTDENGEDVLNLPPQLVEQLSGPGTARNLQFFELDLPPGITGRIFIHRIHEKDLRPPSLGLCTSDQSDPTAFGLAGWSMPAPGLFWKLNRASLPSSIQFEDAKGALQAAFQAWTNADKDKKFTYAGETPIRRPKLDYENIVTWGKLGSGTIAVTYIRYNTATKVVVDVDTVFNSRYPWYIFTATSDCISSPVAYDIQDIATHEFGHWIGLDDLYSDDDKDLTMYGYGAGGELKKRTLELGDIAGANEVAP